MVLHGERRHVHAAQPLERPVVEVPMRELDRAAVGVHARRRVRGRHDRAVQTRVPRSRVDREPVVVARDLHPRRAEVLDRLVHAAVPELHLEARAAESVPQELVPKADPEHREPSEQRARRGDPVPRRSGIAGTVGQEQPVERAAIDLLPRGLRGEHGGLDPLRSEQTQDVPLDPEVQRGDAVGPPGPRRRLADELTGLVRLRRRDVLGEIGALHPSVRAHPRDERVRIEVDRRHATAHRTGLADPQRQPPRVHALDPDDARRGQLVVYGPPRPPARRPPGGLPDDEPGDLHVRGLGILVVHAVVPLVRGGHHDDLPRVGGVRQDLLVAGHAGVEHDLAERLSLGPEPESPEGRPVLEDEQRLGTARAGGGHRCGFRSATTSSPR